MSQYRWIIILFLISYVIFSAQNVQCQQTNLEVTASPTNLEAGFNTTVTFTVLNDFEPIYDLDVSLSFPQAQLTTTAPTSIGVSNWRFDRVKEGENVTFQSLIFVPKDAAGNAFIANIAITYKRLGYISPSSETYSLGFYVKGHITMMIYDFEVEPDPVDPGSTVSITASILNKGSIPAQFTNVTLMGSQILNLRMESYSYLGEVDPNSPSPFTLEATVNPDTSDGNYSITIRVEYEDDESVAHTIERTVAINVYEVAEEEVPKGILETILDFIQANLLYVIIGIVILIIVGAVVRRRTSQEVFEERVT